MDTKALEVSDQLTTVAISKDDVLLFHFPSNCTEEDLKGLRDLFKREDGTPILHCEAVFLPGEIKMTVIQQTPKT
jgi:hypothetical protein